MDAPAFKRLFGAVAKRHGFDEAHSGWFRDSEQCTVVLDLQRSNFGQYFDLNVKVYIHDLFGFARGSRTKQLVRGETGHVFRRPPPEYSAVFDLEAPCTLEERAPRVDALFNNFLDPFVKRALTRQGLADMAAQGQIFLLPAVAAALRGLTGTPA